MAARSKHDPFKVGLIVATIGVYALVLVMNQLASRKSKRSGKFLTESANRINASPPQVLFPNDVGEVSRLYPLDITPAPIVFPIIWSIIYFWQVRRHTTTIRKQS